MRPDSWPQGERRPAVPSPAFRALSVNNRALSKSMQELSTGKRINSAADDAAGLAISTRMQTQIQMPFSFRPHQMTFGLSSKYFITLCSQLDRYTIFVGSPLYFFGFLGRNCPLLIINSIYNTFREHAWQRLA